ncbi:YcgN family cysteine cluster protein [Alcanivorax quisquiliarum]|uniref:UPF0260 protein MU846_13515 n=1 Tax=Alcanivorax quisquiliarum TaxID=2933565 RepID=A0ABT0EAG2_9GAMM|nr:YcgN family cysteine cluster protein [Alcanivorax quisquiliarum]MCK0538727.1 YcgN family cysteine cluster protein [Alcanivorax quisquiliarum]
MRERFWERFSLAELNIAEWEALCDGCGRCCLVKLEDEDTGELHYTHLACRMLDTDTSRCLDYAARQQHVPDCVQMTPETAAWDWLPDTCAYRRLARGEGLASWHPLISGSGASVVEAGISVRGRVFSETLVDEDEYEDHIIRWVS